MNWHVIKIAVNKIIHGEFILQTKQKKLNTYILTTFNNNEYGDIEVKEHQSLFLKIKFRSMYAMMQDNVKSIPYR